MQGEGRTILLTTHYMEEAEALCDRLAIMDHGKILEMGTVEELIARRFHERGVRFDAVPALPDEAASRPCQGCRGSCDEDGKVALYTPDVAATIGGAAELTPPRRRRARQPGRPAGDASRTCSST